MSGENFENSRNNSSLEDCEELPAEYEPCLNGGGRLYIFPDSDSDLPKISAVRNGNLKSNGTGKFRKRNRREEPSPVILQIDRSNFCILSVLLLLLILITAGIAFVLDAHHKISGEVTILIECMKHTKRIVLNAGKNLEIENASLRVSRTGKTMPWVSLFRHPGVPLFTIATADSLVRGSFYKLFLSFKAKICGSDSGVYCYRPPGNGRSKRAEASFSSRPLSLTTKLEPTLAKTLFPCWDEPDLKAIFNVSITHSDSTKVLSNAATYKQTTDKARHSATDYFHETPPMSTYLLALAAGPFVAIERESDRGIKGWRANDVSTWTMPEDHYKAEFASDYAVYIFNKLEEYFVVKYPLSKLDLVASRNFPVGGMENWGLIIFHYDMLLLEEEEEEEGSGEMADFPPIKSRPEIENLIPKYRTTKIILHELIHQWFGNLVTMKWWSDLWLNEGFTTFYANYFIGKTYPMLAEYEYFMRLGELWTRQTYGQKGSLVQEFETEESIMDSFDQWNLYCKGSVAIKMLWDLLGEQTLRGGVIEYLRANAYSSVKRADLWRHLGRMSHFSLGKVQVDQVMESWVNQPGFPEIHILRNYEDRRGEIVIRQRIADGKQNQAFMQKPESEDNLEWRNLTWAIPLLYVIEGQPNPSRPFWIWNGTFIFQDMDLKNSKWLLANSNFQFPYRINYDRRNWHMLIHALYRSPKIIPGRSRMQLILDSAVFLKDSYDLPLYIELLGYLRNETELLPLLTGLQHIHSLLNDFRATNIYPLLLICLRPVATQLVKRWNESFLSSEEQAIWKMDERRLREYHRFRCSVNEKSCQISRTRAQQILSAPGTGHTSLYIAVCQFLHNQHTDSEKLIVLRILEEVEETAPKQLLLLASCVRDREVTEKLSEILVRMQNLAVLAEVFGTEYSLHINRNLRQMILKKLSRLTPDKKLRLFRNKNLTKLFLGSIRSSRELELAEMAIPGLEEEKKYLRLKLGWMEDSASPQIERWLLRVLKIQ